MNQTFMALLPFWILGAPFVLAIINLLMLPKESEIVRRSEHRRA